MKCNSSTAPLINRPKEMVSTDRKSGAANVGFQVARTSTLAPELPVMIHWPTAGMKLELPLANVPRSTACGSGLPTATMHFRSQRKTNHRPKDLASYLEFMADITHRIGQAQEVLRCFCNLAGSFAVGFSHSRNILNMLREIVAGCALLL